MLMMLKHSFWSLIVDFPNSDVNDSVSVDLNDSKTRL